MKAINFDLLVSKKIDGVISIEPIIEKSIPGKTYNVVDLQLGDGSKKFWAWVPATIPVSTLQSARDWVNHNNNSTPFWTTHKIIREANPAVYVGLMKTYFQSFRCGIDYNEMLWKVFGRFGGPDWREDYSNCLINEHTSTERYHCTITPLYGTIGNCLTRHSEKRTQKVTLERWHPTIADDYEVVWHFSVALSNGNQYRMQLPVCSPKRWLKRVEHYLDKNPTAMHSPDSYCYVSLRDAIYQYDTVWSLLNKLASRCVGTSPEEVLLKLSTFLNYDKRPALLQKILSHDPYELVFSGTVHWLEP
jgi:hypothetical protein